MHKPGTSPVYSPSRISTYESCPRQYRYRYIDRIPREEESIEAFLGSRVHEALNRLYRDLLLGKHPNLNDILNYYDWQWRRQWHDQVKIVKQDCSIENYKRLGERCLKDYHDAHKPFDRGQTLGLEHRVTSSLDPAGRYRIQGYIDRLVSVGSGRYEIHDFKTSGRLPGQGLLDADRQLALYQLGVQGKWPEAKEIELVWHYLAFGKELRSRRTPEALDRLKATTIALIERIETDTEFKPIKSTLCHWCAYKDICPVWNDRPVTTSTLSIRASDHRRSADLTAQDDGHAFDLRAVSREALREAILAAAETEGAEIRFTDHGDLWVRMAQLTPPAALDGRADGWTQLSDESLPLLFRQVERARWSATFVEKLERYLAS
ncbi:MAG: PD-(D/E)XK nuclease family protein [candidate division NC10 bacterium]|nr:PD-(D/E)XK nuclease family protein [candidate division NC10 bacterium]